ncbi:unnamed protein product [Effrenium voratum]|uniref:CSD domain-containing protein n=1 Tax=Effrenium voratum TaxID=2562239 RepID=A0AA36I1F8_9DINO|nr:unnamed protein product [Effrenium voratum]CAJ1428656.1 unnamed protein product [Effrenium voratum]
MKRPGVANDSSHRVKRGRVRSFSGQWGFINSPEFSGDLFVGLRRNPQLSGLAPGDEVDFAVAEVDGKLEATEVQLVRLNERREEVLTARPMAQVTHLVGQRFAGNVRFRDSWGRNPDLEPILAGDPVNFQVAEDGDQCHADSATVPKSTLSDLHGRHLSGWVKSFKGNWGLIQSSHFDGDLFVGLGRNPQLKMPLVPGEGVTFLVNRDERAGKFQATEVQSDTSVDIPPGVARPIAGQPEDGARQEARELPELVGEVCAGVVKSFRDGWGFVNSDAFVGDLFLHEGSNPGLPRLQPGDPVEFVVQLQGKLGTALGKPHATNVKLQSQATSFSRWTGQLCSGTVKKFSGEWGFIVSPQFEGDLFVGTRSNPHISGGLLAGDIVEFEVFREKGKEAFEAVKVRVLSSVLPLPSLRRQASGRSRSPRLQTRRPRSLAVNGLEGQMLTGTIRSFKGDWGFVNSPAFAGDLFIGTKSNRHLAGRFTEGAQATDTCARWRCQIKRKSQIAGCEL